VARWRPGCALRWTGGRRAWRPPAARAARTSSCAIRCGAGRPRARAHSPQAGRPALSRAPGERHGRARVSLLGQRMHACINPNHSPIFAPTGAAWRQGRRRGRVHAAGGGRAGAQQPARAPRGRLPPAGRRAGARARNAGRRAARRARRRRARAQAAGGRGRRRRAPAPPRAPRHMRSCSTAWGRGTCGVVSRHEGVFT